MSPSAPRQPMVQCPHCGAMNDPNRGSTRCYSCNLPLNRVSEVVPVAEAEPATRAEVIAVPFLDGHIPCVEVGDDPMVILRPISDLLGLAWSPQRTKLAADPAACVTFIVTQLPGDDQSRKVMAVSLETFTVWLARLQPSRVKAEARDTVIAYQREASRALRDHFFGPQRIREGDELALLEETNGRLARAIEIAKSERARADVAEAEIEHMTPMVEAYEQVIDTRGLIPMAVFAQQSQIIRPNGKSLGQNTATEILREIGVLKDAPGTEAHNTPYQQHAHRIQTRTEQRGPVTVNVPYVVPAHAQYLAARIGEHLYPGRARLPRPRLGQLRAIGSL